MFIMIFQRILLEALLDLLYFPIWWYSGGLIFAFSRVKEFFFSGNAFLAPGIWLRNIFVPMFGQYDWQGRIISFFMRLVQVIFRSLALAVWGAICIILFLFWIILPAIIVLGLANSLIV
ncbi:hypothetical protein KKA13_03540 [Patescibacteria group bacterium]|nr:hypothetical protein [Patescibacteria group bacterium]MBU1612919.1 hypothetical protein [Patescibacteria group bacterium]